MKFLHTGDWHLGKRLEGRDRLPEQRAVLAEITRIAAAEEVDVVLVAGDVFDTAVPSGEAEGLFYDAVSALADGGRREVIVIAGNHDDVERVTAADALAAKVHIHCFGGARKLVLEKNGETAAFALLSYPSEARMQADADRSSQRGAAADGPAAAIEEAAATIDDTPAAAVDDTPAAAATYGQKVRDWFAPLTDEFRPDRINIAVSHLFALGGSGSGDEREIELGGARLVDKKFLPACHYVALGHLHKPQAVDKKRHIHYSGSILGYSFDERTAKEVIVFSCDSGRGVTDLRHVPLTAGKRLVTLRAAGFDEALAKLRAHPEAYTALELDLAAPLTDAENKTLKTAFPDLLKIQLNLPEGEKTRAEGVRTLSKDELFRRFYERRTGGPPPPAVLALFLQLMEGEV